MRRVFSLFVLLALAVPPALPVFAIAPSDVHACCRRGAHACHAPASDSATLSSVPNCCRCYQTSPPSSTEAVSLSAVSVHTSVEPIAVGAHRLEPSRTVLSRDGRAPPPLSLA